MIPIQFEQANCRFTAPPDMDEVQVATVWAYKGQAHGGSCDGAQIVVTAWKPSPDEIEAMMLGKPIYMTFIGGLPPHYPSVDFELATNPT